MQLQRLAVGALGLAPHFAGAIDVARRVAQLGEGTLGVEVLVVIFVGEQAVDILVPVAEVLRHDFGRQRFQRVLVETVAQAVGHGIGVGPLHRETFLDKELTLVLVLLENPLRDGRVVENADVGILRVGAGREIHRDVAHDLHQFLLARHDGGIRRILLVAAQPFLEPAFRLRAPRSVVVVDVFLVESIGQGVLRDDDKVATVEVRVAAVLRIDKAFTEDHVGRHETSGVRATENKSVLRQVLQHVVPVVPAEPVVALTAERRVVDPGPKRQKRQHIGRVA